MKLRKLLTVLMSCAALLGSMAAMAGLLYKSKMPDGRVIYSNAPIEEAKTVKLIDNRPRSSGVRIVTPEQKALSQDLGSSRQQRHRAQLVGTWRTDSIKDVYDPDEQFSLILELENKGDGFSGTVRELREGDSPQMNYAILNGTIENDRISFYTQHNVDGEGKPVPYRTMYKGTIQGDRIAFTRQDNHPKGGSAEQFVAVRNKSE